jgi:rubrerythrin
MRKNFADELINQAVKREEESHRLYTEAAKIAKRPEVKKLFTEFATQELEHKEKLRSIDLNELEKIEPKKLSDPNLSLLLEAEPLSEGFTIQDALLYAIKREDESYRFYKEFAQLAEDTKLKNVFENLATMEMHHKRTLEEMYEQKIYQEN